MPWKEVTTMQEKERFIETYKNWKGSFCHLCKEFRITPKTGYKYIQRFKKHGFEGLKEQSRKPKTSPNKTKKNIEKVIVETRNLHPVWSGEKIKQYLCKKGFRELPTEKTIDRILKRYGLITAQESEKHKAWKRFEHENPNDLWQMDFKGYIIVGGQRCHPLTLLDDHSRYALLIKACTDQRSDTVKKALINLFREYGLPYRMTMDNGSPWGYSGEQQFTNFCAWLIRLGIYVSHSRPMHPQTQGKLERFHRTLNLELLKRFYFANIAQAQEGFDWWRKIYNEERPHEGIGNEVPINRYKTSKRCYPEILPPIEYGKDLIVRKVQKNGIIYIKGKEYRVGKAFFGSPVGLKETEEDGVMDVYFCQQKVVKINLSYPI